MSNHTTIFDHGIQSGSSREVRGYSDPLWENVIRWISILSPVTDLSLLRRVEMLWADEIDVAGKNPLEMLVDIPLYLAKSNDLELMAASHISEALKDGPVTIFAHSMGGIRVIGALRRMVSDGRLRADHRVSIMLAGVPLAAPVFRTAYWGKFRTLAADPSVEKIIFCMNPYDPIGLISKDVSAVGASLDKVLMYEVKWPGSNVLNGHTGYWERPRVSASLATMIMNSLNQNKGQTA